MEHASTGSRSVVVGVTQRVRHHRIQCAPLRREMVLECPRDGQRIAPGLDEHPSAHLGMQQVRPDATTESAASRPRPCPCRGANECRPGDRRDDPTTGAQSRLELARIVQQCRCEHRPGGAVAQCPLDTTGNSGGMATVRSGQAGPHRHLGRRQLLADPSELRRRRSTGPQAPEEATDQMQEPVHRNRTGGPVRPRG